MGPSVKQSLPCYRKYGVPLYWASWVPPLQRQQQQILEPSDASDEEEKQTRVVNGASSSTPQQQYYLVFGGGGGDSRSGIQNAILLTHFDFPTNSLSEPVDRIGTDDDIPYRMAMHPCGDGLICSFPKDCRWFDWDVPKDMETHNLAVKTSEKRLTQLEDVGMQKALAFNRGGSVLAVGGEDGHLRVFKWPDMEVMLDRSDAHESIKDLDFSSDGKLLASLGSTGPCRIWDLASSTTVASLPREKGDNFVFCRFSQDNQLLYVATIKQGKGVIMSWDTTSWKIAGARQIVHDSISAFNISADGKLLAIGTTEGDIVIVDSFNLQVRKTVKKAHLFFVTTVEFSRDDRALVSVSSDSSARVTVIEDQNQRATGMWVVVFVIILLAMLIFYIKSGAFH